METCACGCSGRPARGEYLPGHDQKLRAKLESQLGGLSALNRLFEAAISYTDGHMSLEGLGTRTRDIVLAGRKRRGS